MLANLLLAIQQSTKNYAPQVVTGVVGTTRNLAMNVTAASATATITADEVVVETALGGSQYRIGSFSKTINLATTGAGGMDTGTVPANGFVGIYAIYNPTTGASALLAVNAAAVIGEVYGGNNMPNGYTASALLTVVPTGSSQFKVVSVSGRKISIQAALLYSGSSALTNAQISIASVIPLNSKSVTGFNYLSNTASGTMSIGVAGSLQSVAQQQTGAYLIGGVVVSIPYVFIPIYTPGSIFLSSSNATSGTPTYSVYGSGYEI